MVANTSGMPGIPEEPDLDRQKMLHDAMVLGTQGTIFLAESVQKGFGHLQMSTETFSDMLDLVMRLSLYVVENTTVSE